MSDTITSCAECRFWDRLATLGSMGDCRRHAPRHLWIEIHPGTQDEECPREGVWPLTCEDDWCGEFEADTHAL